MVDVQLGLHIGPKQLEQGLSQRLLPVHVWDVLLTGLPFWPHWERMCLALKRLEVLGWFIHRGSLNHSEENGDGLIKRGGDCEGAVSRR